MAYGEKYYHEYCDRYGDTYRISLQEDGYTGLSTEVECGYEQFLIEQEASENILIGGVRPTRATATFVSSGSFELQEIYTGTERTYLLVRYKNGNLNWQGNVPSEGFSQSNWDAKHIQLTVKATDNLSGLKSEPFTENNGENYGIAGDTRKTFLWAIKEGLKKTGFNMNIWTFVDLKPMTQSGVSAFSVRLQKRTGFDDQFILTFGNIDDSNRFKNDAQPGKFFRVTSGEIQGYTTNVVSASGTQYIYVIVTDTVPTFTSYNTVVEIGNAPGFQSGDPLFYTEHDVGVWLRDSNVEGKTYFEARGGAMDSWAVLDAIARQWHVKIYQNNGHWEVKRINADKLNLSAYSWYVYNSEGTAIGTAPMGQVTNLPCAPTETEYRIFGTVISMDRVLKNVIVNYEYKYRQDGDVLANLIENPNFKKTFGGFSSTSPSDWSKIDLDGRTPKMTVQRIEGSTPMGIDSYVTIRNMYRNQFYANRENIYIANSIREVTKGDKIRVSWWDRISGTSSSEDGVASVIQITVWDNDIFRVREANVYDLTLSKRGSIEVRNLNGVDTLEQQFETTWERYGEGTTEHKCFGALQGSKDGVGKGVWRKVILDIPELPISGFVSFEIVGVVPTFLNGKPPLTMRPPLVSPSKAEARRVLLKTYIQIDPNRRDTELRDTVSYLSTSLSDTQQYTLDITGIQFNKIVDPSNDVVPQIDPFMYPSMQDQLTREFSDTISEVKVLTGDDYGEYVEDRLSGMTWEGEPTQFWDTWDERFGWSRQGLITAKSIIENYWKPTRLIQCEIGVKDFDWSTLITFEELPGLRFVVLRGAIGGKDSTFRGTLKEIYGELEELLPPGGQDGGNTTTPDWQPTGVVRCVKGEDGLNTGRLERIETDINQASTTYGQERWVDAGINTDSCPIGEPQEIYWGTQLVLDVETLYTYPYDKTDDVYLVSYNNDGSDGYLRLLHRADLGTVRSIFYDGGYENLSGWEYESDVVIDGYTYKSMKLTWFVGIFENLNVNFVIN